MAQIRKKVYPDGNQSLLISDLDLWKIPDLWWLYPQSEPREIGRNQRLTPEEEETRHTDNIERSRRRACVMVRDYCLCSDMEYFVTLTMAPDRINRYDVAEVVKKTRKWLDNHVRRGQLKAYVMIPERHKDGAIHWHGLWKLGTMQPVDSGTISGIYKKPARPRSDEQRSDWLRRGGHIVYNMPAWCYGYSTAIKLYGSYEAAVAYTCKYLAKGTEKIGGRWYYSGGDLRQPHVYYSMVPQDVYKDLRGSDSVKILDSKKYMTEFLAISSKEQEQFVKYLDNLLFSDC